ncbi:hypothetical protein ACSBR1_033749 [Camellia fascicularis]
MMDRFMRVIAFLVLVILTIATINLSSCNGDVVCINSEKQALLSFKQELKDPSNRLSSWDVEDDCCKWAGVVCDKLNGHVIELHLQNPNSTTPVVGKVHQSSALGGKIDPSLVNLTRLNYLDLSQNDFGGIHIPRFIGSLANLHYLSLSGAGFGGTIPHQLGNLSSLRFLSLSGGGSYPGVKLCVVNLQWLSGLSRLERLDFSQVNLKKASGDWLQVINMLPSLVELNLSSCELHRVPPQLHHVNFSSLTLLDLSKNDFNSLIPGWISSLSSLVSLHLSSCGFGSLFPDGFCNLTSLKALDLSQNDLNSSPPSWLFSLNGLVSLNSNSNRFQGPVPHGPWNSTSLRSFDVSQSELNSSLPNALFSLNDLLSLNLHQNGFEGPLPSSLWNITSFRDLDLSENNFNSTIPVSLYSCSHLESLNLGHNQFQGAISSNVGNLTSVTILDLSYNKLEGRIPVSMGNLCNLRVINLSSNKLTVQVLDVLKSLSGCILESLETFGLWENKLFGHFTEGLGRFKNLRELYFQNNLISGPIPMSVGRLSSFVVLDLSYNKLNGTLPKSLGHLSKLRILYISYNMLEGVVSEDHFANLPSLVELSASGNQLSFDASPNWIPPFQLELVYLRSWQLGPQFPIWLQSQKRISKLDLSCTGISVAVPTWFWNVSSSTTYVNLSYNQILGEVGRVNFIVMSGTSMACPHVSGIAALIHSAHPTSTPAAIKSAIMTAVEITNHSGRPIMDGDKPAGVFTTGAGHVNPERAINPGLVYDIRSDEYITHLCTLGYTKSEIFAITHRNVSCHETLLENRGFSLNYPSISVMFKPKKMSKVIKRQLTNVGSPNSIYSVEVVEPEGVKIPSSMGLIPYLHSLHLRNNSLSGSLPSSMQHWIALLALDLAENEFIGNIPTWIGKGIPNLQILSLRSNNFHGKVSPELCRLASLQILDLADNNLSGSIPSCINNFTGMVFEKTSAERNSYSFHFGAFLENAYVVTKGSEFDYDTIVKLVTSMDLSSNNFSGEIPQELTSLLGLRSLNLSNNHLSGMIPPKIDEMGLLESLDFSRNQLSGEIPPSMSDLTFLSYLNLSYNNLSGRIPSSTQLQSFDASSYIGNKLCGPPLTKNCSVDGVAPNPGNNGDDGGAKSEVYLFYLWVACGFAMGFWVVIGPLLFRRSWRIACFRFLDDMWDRFYVLLRVNFNKFQK